jgi:hypothetical protein
MYTSEQQIEDFICEYMRSRVVAETTLRAVLRRAVEHEDRYSKHFYEFSEDEILTIFKEAHVISDMSLQNWNNILKHASRWMLFRQNKDTINAYEAITKEKVKDCVDTTKKNSMVLSREDVTRIQEDLHNWTDKAILELLFLGVGGKWLRELCYLEASQVSERDKMIYFRNGKQIPIDSRGYKLLDEAFRETEMMSYSDEPKVSVVRSVGIYKIKHNTLYENDNAKDETDAERRFRWVQRRLAIIRDYVGVPMTSGTIQTSGMLHCLQRGIAETGMSFREYIFSDAGKALARRYDYYSELYATTLVEKFKKYFE